MDQILDMLSTPLMQRGLLAALLVGIVAPVMGTFLVQRRLSLLGDGIGHVALTGVALGWLVGAAAGVTPVDALAVPGAVVAAVGGAVGIEIVRERGRTSADVALALLFYGGIAGGVIIIQLAGGQSSNLMAYLFGSISVVTTWDLVLTAVLALVVLGLGVGLRPALFTVSHDEEFARASGLPVRLLNVAIAVMAALTVTVAMRVVGLLLVSALMIVPVAVAQLLTRSFVTTMRLAIGIGVVACVVGLSATYWWDVSPGAMIVVLTIAAYAVVATLLPVLRGRQGRRDPHPDLPADVVLEG
ncbi:metal ABC transporter permease [Flavimobilis sp. GY10621]|uniref:Metal ABC transporter permease n=1 Tax=Flavimobilis rhizosphaerae TaxID=2775421 RepID=A0ABR9DSM3_9MICO|nr:metal ABC transporter permease [Flavimobilis rhizosphaerae]MBD9700140.1 metal ABC transporter permease [Flavimobilis rhizosphaerae]